MPVQELLDYLQYRAGDALRVVGWYSDDDWGSLYIRDDLDRNRVEDRLDYVTHQLSERGRLRRDPLTELGDERAMVQVREDAVVMRFSLNGGGGMLVSLDTVIARDLHGFVVECAERLEGEELGFLTG